MFVHFSSSSLTSLNTDSRVLFLFHFLFIPKEGNIDSGLSFYHFFFYFMYNIVLTPLHTIVAYLLYAQVSTILQNPQGKVRNKALCVCLLIKGDLKAPQPREISGFLMQESSTSCLSIQGRNTQNIN